ncbi:MAG: RidA family protein [Acidimicrobiia bacterium]|nr:RidA family protein [Acidimicrobiia bacterium]
MSDAPARPVGPYSPVVRAGDWIIVSGQIGLRDGALVEGGLGPELVAALANLVGQLASVGARLDQVAKTTVFLTDMADYAAMNEAYVAALGDHRPARSAVAVSGLPLGATVEIEAWAHVPEEADG